MDERRTILLVDDEPIIALSEKMQLQKIGYTVITVFSGDNALYEGLNNPEIDLILMDIDLGNPVDGTEIAASILNQRDIPIVFLSSHTEPEIVQKTENITSYGYVVKNSGITVLDASIKMAFKLYNANKSILLREEILNESEEKYRRLFNVGRDAIFLVDAETTSFIDVNAAALNLYGYTREEFLMLKAVDISAEPEKTHKAISGNETHVVARMHIKKDGSIFPVEINGNYFNVKNKKIHVAVIHDLTGRKKNIERVKESEEKFRTLIENMPYSISQIRVIYENGIPADYEYIMVNPEFEKMTGLRNATGKRVSDLIPGYCDKNPESLRIFGRVAETLEPFQWDHYSKAFKKWYFYTAFSHVKGEAIIVGEEITERKIMEETLIQKERQLNIIANTIPAVITYVNADDLRYRYVNYNFASSRNMSQEEVVGKEVCEILGEDAYKRAAPYIERARAGKTVTYENIVPFHGEPRWFNISYTPEFDAGGNVRNLIVLAFDITERKLAEERITGLLREKELLLQEVHHRIKNNMNTINSLIALQAESLQDRAISEALKDTGRRVQSMMVLYDKLYQSTDFNELSVANYLSSLVDEIIANFPNCKSVKIVKKIDDFLLSVKKLQPLGIIINELLTNIMKYAFTGSSYGVITFNAEVAGNNVVIVIQDNGCGLPESINIGKTSGFGLMLVDILTVQLEATVKIERVNGTKFVIEFEK